MIQTTPPNILYHGTSKSFVTNIDTNGLIKQNHEHVYMTNDIMIAYEYASRYEEHVICVIDAKQMYVDGFTFYINDQKEYLVNNVPAKYLLMILIEDEADLQTIKESVTTLLD